MSAWSYVVLHLAPKNPYVGCMWVAEWSDLAVSELAQLIFVKNEKRVLL